MKRKVLQICGCLLVAFLGITATAEAGFRFSFGFGIGFGGGHYRPYYSTPYYPVRYTIVPRRTHLRRVYVPSRPANKRNYSDYVPRRYTRRIR